MQSPRCWKWCRVPVLACVLALAAQLQSRGDHGPHADGPRCLDDLKHLSECQLAELFRRAEVGNPLVGRARGRLVCAVDARLPRVRMALANSVWRGKRADESGHFVNRWIGGIERIESSYVIGPSWVDGKPAIVMEYAPGTPLFANTRDELREIAPGLYLGPLYERCPCPKLRGYLALQVECCD